MSVKPSQLVERIVEDALREVVPRTLRGRIVDIGCGRKPYRALVAPHVSEHIGVDRLESWHGTDAIDLVGTAYEIPSADAEFDGALCTAVLEHLEEPEQALRECFRVLKPGAFAVYTAPMIWHLHEEPRDFYRFTRYGLQHLFTKVGFEVVEIRALSGFWMTFGTLFLYNVARLDRGPLRALHALDPVAAAIRTVTHALDRLDRTEKWTWMYLVIARKP